MTIKLIYTGRGGFFFHVPARDLTDEDFAERAELWKENNVTEASLIASGLYKKPDKAEKIIETTAGIWKDRPDSDFEFIEDRTDRIDELYEKQKQPKNKAAKDGK